MVEEGLDSASRLLNCIEVGGASCLPFLLSRDMLSTAGFTSFALPKHEISLAISLSLDSRDASLGHAVIFFTGAFCALDTAPTALGSFLAVLSAMSLPL